MKKKILAYCAMSLIICCVAIGAFVYVQAQKSNRALPVVSHVENLSIISQRVENLGNQSDTAMDIAAFDFVNDMDKPIVAISFESGDDIDSNAYNLVSHTEDQPYLALPRQTFRVQVPLDGFDPKLPLRITSVVYEDGTATGEIKATEYLKKRTNEVRESKNGGRK